MRLLQSPGHLDGMVTVGRKACESDTHLESGAVVVLVVIGYKSESESYLECLLVLALGS